jgi:hypothetical protein
MRLRKKTKKNVMFSDVTFSVYIKKTDSKYVNKNDKKRGIS